MDKRYIGKLDMKLSPLGFGVMRLPVTAGGFPPETYALMSAALERGINYFDTAYTYLGGLSEVLIREALVKQHPRDSFHIADKLPVWECSSRDDMDRIFDEQLQRLGTDYVDFYLLHGLHRARWLDVKSKGVLDFLDEKRREGRIRRVGFSMHDYPDTLEMILDSYDWQFAQLQINYYDWSTQNAKGNYECLERRGVPCMVMEPVGGGRLARLPENAEKLLRSRAPNESAVSLAMRFAGGLPNVAVTLSGMNDLAQLEQNVSSFSPLAPLDSSESALLGEVCEIIKSCHAVPCTACRYCTDGCPKGIDIPSIFQKYNDSIMFPVGDTFDALYFSFTPEGKRGCDCIACGKCVKSCPQNIDIPDELKKIHSVANALSIGVDIDVLKKELSGDGVLVCFGAGEIGRRSLSVLNGCDVRIGYFCDNAEALWGTAVETVPVISPDELVSLCSSKRVVIKITSSYQAEIAAQLDSLGLAEMVL